MGSHVLKVRRNLLFSINYIELSLIPRNLSYMLQINAEEHVD